MRNRTATIRHLGSIGVALLLTTACSGGGGGGGDSAGGNVTAPPPVTPPAQGLVSAASTFTAGCNGVVNSGTLYVNAEVEPHIAINPTNPNNLIASWQQDRWSDGAAQGVGIAFSFDAGATWTTRALPASRCGGGNSSNGGDYARATDPWVTFSPNGTAYQMSLAINGAILQPGSSTAMLVFRSTDGGRNWSAPVAVIADGERFFNDKNSITADPTDSRYVYAVWDRLTSDNRGPAMFARTIDGGQSWEPARVIYDPGVNNQTLGSVISVLPDGTVINFFATLRVFANTTATEMTVIRSTDKGATWSAPIRVADFRGIGTRDPETGQAIRDAGTLPQLAVSPQGVLIATWQDARFSNGARDAVAAVRSSDGGLTWTAPVQVSSVPAAQAFTPSVNVRADGTIGISYFDMRNNTADAATLLVDHWLATSIDGTNWTDRRVTPASFNLATAPVARGLFLGDYMGLVSAGSNFFTLFVRTTGDLANRNDVFIAPVGVPVASAVLPMPAASAPPMAAEYAQVSAEFQQRIHENILQQMERRAPGWAARRGLANVPPAHRSAD